MRSLIEAVVIALLTFGVLTEGDILRQMDKRIAVVEENSRITAQQLDNLERDIRRTGELHWRLDEVSPDRAL